MAGLLLVTGCRKSDETGPARETDPAPGHLPHAQPKLPTIKVWVGAEELQTEMALTRVQLLTGMMWRTNMPENTAMIFVHPEPQQAGFWMANVVIPLSIAYINSDGVILEIHDLQPQNTNSVLSATADVRFALEVPQGWFGRHNITTGAVVRTERGTLLETFFPRR